MTKENELIPYTFKDTQVKVKLRKVSPLLALELRRAYPEPKPPMQEVDYGDGEKKLEPNPSHPDYVRELEEHNIKIELLTRKMLIKRGVVCDVPMEDVEQLQADWLDLTGTELPEKDPLVAYISYIAIGSDKDMEELIYAVMRRSQPTEEAVASHQDTFQS